MLDLAHPNSNAFCRLTQSIPHPFLRMKPKTTIVLVFDGLSASLPGPYGNTTVDTPGFNRLASISTLSDFCIVRSPELAAGVSHLWSPLSDCQGHRCLLTDSEEVAQLGQQDGLFDSIDAIQNETAKGLAESIGETTSAHFFARAIEKIQSSQPGDLLWLHHDGLYGTWDAPYSIRQSLADEEDPDPPTDHQRPALKVDRDVDPDELLGYQQSAYAQLVVLDHMLSLFLEQVSSLPHAAETELVVTSLRGYPLGEHQSVGIPDNLFSESVHVPFFHCHAIDGSVFGSRQGNLCFADGVLREILETPDTQEDENELFISTAESQISAQDSRWKLIFDPHDPEQAMLFAKPDDRWEVNDVSRRCRDVVDSMIQQVLKAKPNLQAGL